MPTAKKYAILYVTLFTPLSTKLEEFSVWLAANGEHDSNPNPVKTSNPPPSVPPSEAENSTGNTTPL
jgi:hypothetical protein